MSNDEIRQLRDVVLGEAVMALFADQRPLSNESVIKQLMQMAASESDTHRRKACLEAVRQVRKNSTLIDRQHEVKKKQSGDNTLH
ncbi:hypothetical protein AAH450_08895 [Erwinia sp. P7711]|uniref:hypothetical protein n=1 Tax=Erwinia sp. P7711 TaxID=3141451 RepID=UPI0031893764